MTREQAKKNLISFGIESPTEEQITNYLNSVDEETKSEKARAEKYKADAGKLKDVQQELDNLKSQGLTDAEKAEKDLEDAQKEIAELKKANIRSEVKSILATSNLEEKEYEGFIDGFVSDDLEESKTRATSFVETIKNTRTATEAKIKEERLDGTKGLGGNGGDGGEEKPDDVKNVENITFGGLDKDAQTARDYYK